MMMARRSRTLVPILVAVLLVLPGSPHGLSGSTDGGGDRWRTTFYHLRIVRVTGALVAPGAAVTWLSKAALPVFRPGAEPWGTEEQLQAIAEALDGSRAFAVTGYVIRTGADGSVSFRGRFYPGPADVRFQLDAAIEDPLSGWRRHRVRLVLVEPREGGTNVPLAEAELLVEDERTVAIAIPSPLVGEWIVFTLTPVDENARTEAVIEELDGIRLAGVGGVGMPRLIPGTRVRPVYPDAARGERRQGKVFLRAIIDEEGRVRAPVILKVGPGDEDLAAAAIDAVLQWRYEPATLDGVPVPVYMVVTANFSLE